MRKSRIWGAVWSEDGPVAEVRDITTKGEFEELTNSDTFRWWCVQVLDGTRLLASEHTNRKCEPGNPCLKCRQKAPAWWFEYGRRSKSRFYRPAREGAKSRNRASVEDWGERCESMELALKEATEKGFSLVCVMDGHGNRLEWHLVSELTQKQDTGV